MATPPAPPVPTLGANVPKAIEHVIPPLRVAVFGEGGIGKTQLALSFPKPLVIDADGGLEGGAIEQLKERGGVAEQWSPERWKDLNALYFWLKAKVVEKGYETIVVDSISELCIMILHEAMEAATQVRPASKELETLIQAEQQDYGKVAYAMDSFLTKLKHLSKTKGVNVVLTSGVRDKDLEKGRPKRTFDVQPAVESAIKYWANVYGELVIKERDTGQKDADNKAIMSEHRVLWTNPNDRDRYGKTRFAALHPGVVDPTFSKFREEMQKRLGSTGSTNTKETSK